MTAHPDDQFDALELIRRRLADDLHLAVAITTADDPPDPQVSVVNIGVLDHPVSGTPVLALVARRGAKLRNLRRHPRLTLVVRAGWEWVAAVGDVELVGPDDPHPHVGDEARRQLLRDIFHAAGGNYPGLDTYDRVMADERRCAVLVTPDRIWTNPHGSDRHASTLSLAARRRQQLVADLHGRHDDRVLPHSDVSTTPSRRARDAPTHFARRSHRWRSHRRLKGVARSQVLPDPAAAGFRATPSLDEHHGEEQMRVQNAGRRSTRPHRTSLLTSRRTAASAPRVA